jgi:hypothetical protein
VQSRFRIPAEDIIVGIYADIAHNNLVLAWPSMSTQDRSNLKVLSSEHQKAYRILLKLPLPQLKSL